MSLYREGHLASATMEMIRFDAYLGHGLCYKSLHLRRLLLQLALRRKLNLIVLTSLDQSLKLFLRDTL